MIAQSNEKCPEPMKPSPSLNPSCQKTINTRLFMQIGKALKTVVLTAAAVALCLAPALHAQTNWKPNKIATLVSNGVIEFNFWGPNLTAVYGQGSFNNTLESLQPIEFGDGGFPSGSVFYGPTTVEQLTNVMVGPNQAYDGAAGGTDYMCDFIGEFVPPITTNYSFFVSSDDQSALYLSTDISPINQRLIAWEDQWNNADNWQDANGGTTIANQNSSTFIPPGASAPQYPNGIPLVAGNMYFIHYVMQQTGGGYDCQVTYSYFPDIPANGSASDITGANLAYVTQPPSYIAITESPSTIYAGKDVVFTVETDATPYYGQYQWMKNGVPITNADGVTPANGTTYNIIATADDSANTYTCTATFPGANTNVYTSNPIKLTVLPGSLTTGYLKREVWLATGNLAGGAGGASGNYSSASDRPTGINGGDPYIAGLLAGNVPFPTYVSAVTNFEGPINDGINYYDQRISGFFTPAVSGFYTFWVNSDDNSDLYVSTDDTRDNMKLVAQEGAINYGADDWSNSDDWTSNDSGGSTSQDRKSVV